MKTKTGLSIPTISYPENCLSKRPQSLRRSVKFSTVPFEQTELHTWFERDRATVELRDKRTGKTLIEWWDEDVSEAIEDGFLDMNDLHKSAYQAYLDRQ